MDEIAKEIENIEKSAERIKVLAEGNNSLTKNAEIIQHFCYILRFAYPTFED